MSTKLTSSINYGKSLSTLFSSIKSEYLKKGFSPWMAHNLSQEQLNQQNKYEKEKQKNRLHN